MTKHEAMLLKTWDSAGSPFQGFPGAPRVHGPLQARVLRALVAHLQRSASVRLQEVATRAKQALGSGPEHGEAYSEQCCSCQRKQCTASDIKAASPYGGVFVLL
jgi:hypothetical protein